MRAGLGRSANWLQLVRFFVVGVSGYMANLVTFAVAVHLLGVDYRLAATISFVVAVSNNFVWHRLWTFVVRHAAWRQQAMRFLVVSLGSFGASLLILQWLVGSLEVEKVLAQAISLGVVAPVSFVCNKIWSFRP